ncbi:unnamed protein product [Prorocentrum cordatum]|uniref:Uncharacterized protein n=1 Tax=Prorocentrum cordatum TaxID=2364126 RepID=A0ABN9W2Y8_9DINO|nr:unnamed protein product [Polarella glacialis]
MKDGGAPDQGAGAQAPQASILARLLSCDAVADDGDLLERIRRLGETYEEAAQMLEAAASGPDNQGHAGQAGTHRARARLYAQVGRLLGRPPMCAELTPEERRAAEALRSRRRGGGGGERPAAPECFDISAGDGDKAPVRFDKAAAEGVAAEAARVFSEGLGALVADAAARASTDAASVAHERARLQREAAALADEWTRLRDTGVRRAPGPRLGRAGPGRPPGGGGGRSRQPTRAGAGTRGGRLALVAQRQARHAAVAREHGVPRGRDPGHVGPLDAGTPAHGLLEYEFRGFLVQWGGYERAEPCGVDQPADPALLCATPELRLRAVRRHQGRAPPRHAALPARGVRKLGAGGSHLGPYHTLLSARRDRALHTGSTTAGFSSGAPAPRRRATPARRARCGGSGRFRPPRGSTGRHCPTGRSTNTESCGSSCRNSSRAEGRPARRRGSRAAGRRRPLPRPPAGGCRADSPRRQPRASARGPGPALAAASSRPRPRAPPSAPSSPRPPLGASCSRRRVARPCGGPRARGAPATSAAPEVSSFLDGGLRQRPPLPGEGHGRCGAARRPPQLGLACAV